MKRNIIFLLWLCAVLLNYSCGEKNRQTDEFIELLNGYRKNELRAILAPDFQLVRTYSSYKNDLHSFLGEYLDRSKAFNGKYRVIETLSAAEPKSFLVQDESDYLKYLSVDFPQWKMTIKRNAENKVSQVIMDTTAGFQQYISSVRNRESVFADWLKKKYPGKDPDRIYQNNTELFEKLRLFSSGQR